MVAPGPDLEGLPVDQEKFRNEIRTLLRPEQLNHYETLGPDLQRLVNTGIFEVTKLKKRGDEVKVNDAAAFGSNSDTGISEAHKQAIGLEDKGGLWLKEVANRLVDLTHTTDPQKRNTKPDDISLIAESYRLGFSTAQGGYERAVDGYNGEKAVLQGYLKQRHDTVADMQGHPKRIKKACEEINKFVATKIEELAGIHEERETLQEQVIGFEGDKNDALVLIRGIVLKEISLARVGIVLGRETDDNQLATRIDNLQQILAENSRILDWVELQTKSYQESAQRQKETAAKADNDAAILSEAERSEKLGQGFAKVAKALKG